MNEGRSAPGVSKIFERGAGGAFVCSSIPWACFLFAMHAMRNLQQKHVTDTLQKGLKLGGMVS